MKKIKYSIKKESYILDSAIITGVSNYLQLASYINTCSSHLNYTCHTLRQPVFTCSFTFYSLNWCNFHSLFSLSFYFTFSSYFLLKFLFTFLPQHSFLYLLCIFLFFFLFFSFFFSFPFNIFPLFFFCFIFLLFM